MDNSINTGLLHRYDNELSLYELYLELRARLNAMEEMKQGAEGETGPPGKQGDIGPTGVEGPRGIQGIQGERGISSYTAGKGILITPKPGVDGEISIDEEVVATKHYVHNFISDSMLIPSEHCTVEVIDNGTIATGTIRRISVPSYILDLNSDNGVAEILNVNSWGVSDWAAETFNGRTNLFGAQHFEQAILDNDTGIYTPNKPSTYPLFQPAYFPNNSVVYADVTYLVRRANRYYLRVVHFQMKVKWVAQ